MNNANLKFSTSTPRRVDDIGQPTQVYNFLDGIPSFVLSLIDDCIISSLWDIGSAGDTIYFFNPQVKKDIQGKPVTGEHE